MPKAQIQKRIRHTPKDLMALVLNVEDYPTFINLVSAVRVLERKAIGETREQLTADVGVQYKFISERFRSKINVDHEENTLSIERAQKGGAVRDLNNDWKFIELGDGSTLIDFKLRVRLKAPPLEYLIRQKFEKATNHIVDVFEARALQLYPVVGAENYDFSDEQRKLIG